MIVVERSSADRAALGTAHYTPEDLVDDGTNYEGVIVIKPWGQELELHKNGMVSIWRLFIKPGHTTSMHCHPGKRTMLILESGRAQLHTLTRVYELQAGDFAHIEAGAFHRTESASGAFLIEVESPPNKKDLVRLQDRYGREGRGYESATG